jgi:hypothetical protein
MRDEHERRLLPMAKHCRRLIERTRQFNERTNSELAAIGIVKKKIQLTRKRISQIEDNANDLRHEFKRRIDERENERRMSTSLRSQDQMATSVRRLSIVVDNVRTIGLKKLSKARRLLRLADQCRRLERPDDVLVVIRSNLPVADHRSLGKILPHCPLDVARDIEQLEHLWKRMAHVQLHIYSLVEKNRRQRQSNDRLITQLNTRI